MIKHKNGLRKYITKADFKAWLQSLPPNTIVGRAFDACACPAAQYLKRQLPNKSTYVAVNQLDVTIGKDLDLYVTPKWLNRFVENLDGEHTRLVKAKEALAALRNT